MEPHSRIYDITVPLSPSLVIYPGDPSVGITPITQLAKGDVANTSHIALCLHSGTHLDAPRHFFAQGDGIDRLDLNTLIGAVRVSMVTGQNHITADMLRTLDLGTAQRILFKTRNSRLWERPDFQPNYIALTASAAHYLVEQGVKLVGIDYLSVDAYEDNDFPVHRILLGANVLILEGLDLRAVTAGDYELTALPLRIQDGDGAPARVILRHLT
jgi:arylformamidase